jgi:cAMP-dependent protein kinase regulator
MAHLDQFDISDTKKKYITEEVNPLLEELVRHTLTGMPADPLPHMIKWLKEKSGEPEYDLEAVAKENTTLQEEIKQMKVKLEEVSSKTASAIKDQAKEEEEEEDEEEDDDIPAPPERSAPAGGRQSVSAEAYGAWNQKKAFTPPVHAKNPEQKERIQKVLAGSFLFSALEEKDMGVILDAVKEVIVEPEQKIIQQGDNGDFMFIVESGKLECWVKMKDGEEKMVKDVGAGDNFGELALLYNCSRAATVKATEKAVCWQLDRETFNHIVKDAAAKKREQYEGFFNKVPLLNSVDAYGRSQVADALQTEKKDAGVDIIKQGEKGDKFYIIQSGECEARKTGDGADMVMALKEGDYFGELALLNNEPRAASVVSKTEVKLLALNRQAFNRLLGPLRDMLLGEADRYK